MKGIYNKKTNCKFNKTKGKCRKSVSSPCGSAKPVED